MKLEEILTCKDINCNEGHYPLGTYEDGEVEWGGCPECVVDGNYYPRVDILKLNQLIKKVREKELDRLFNWCHSIEKEQWYELVDKYIKDKKQS